jgi:hypothetical protein
MEQRQARPEETETNVKQAAAEQDYQECLTWRYSPATSVIVAVLDYKNVWHLHLL